MHTPSTRSAGTRRRPSELALPALLFAVLAMLLLAPSAGAVTQWRPLLLEGLALGLFAVALARTQPGPLLKRVGAALRSGPNLPILLLVLYALVSSRLAPHKGLANAEWLRLAGGVTLYFVAAYAMQVRDRYRVVVDGLIVIALMGTLMEFVHYAHSSSPMSAVFGNRQLLASFLLLLMPLMLVVSLVARDAKRKVLAQIAFTVVAAGLMMAQTRSAWAGAVASLVVLGVIYASRSVGWRQLARKKHRAALVLVPILGAVGLFVAVTLSSPALMARLATLGSLASDVNVHWRWEQWTGTWSLILAHPWFGTGLGSYAVAITQFVQGTPADVVLRSGATLTNNAHNLYLQMLAELGVVGTALYLWVLGAFFFVGFRALRRQASPGRFAVLAACLAAMAGQVVDAAANPAYMFGEVSLFFWLVIGLGMSVAGIAPQPAVVPAAVAAPALRRRGFTPRLAWQGAMLSMVGVLVTSGLAIGQNLLPAEPIYTQVSLFQLTARSPSTGVLPGYARPTVRPGECIEVQLAVQFVGSEVYQAERSPFVTYTIGGSAPAGCIIQNQNFFCVPTTAGPECNNQTAVITANYAFRGQVRTASTTFTIQSEANCGIVASVDRAVLPATGQLETVNITFTAPEGVTPPVLRRIDVPGRLYVDNSADVRVISPTQVQVRAVAGRTYILVLKGCDQFNRSCFIRLSVIVSTRTVFEEPTDEPKPDEGTL